MIRKPLLQTLRDATGDTPKRRQRIRLWKRVRRDALPTCQRGQSRTRGNPSTTATCLGLTIAYAIGAASGTGQEVFDALDSNISPEHVLENGHF